MVKHGARKGVPRCASGSVQMHWNGAILYDLRRAKLQPVLSPVGLAGLDLDDAEFAAGLQHHDLHIVDMRLAVDALLAKCLAA
jgi:hypothetical protein